MKVLILTTTFPRWNDDPTPAFVYELSKRLRNEDIEIVVLAPHHNGAKFYEVMDGLRVYRFPYFYPIRYQWLCYEGGILPNLKKSWLARIQLPLLFLSEFIFAIRIIRKEKIDAIYSHWIVPSGLIGSFISKSKSMPHITTAHAGDVFTMERYGFLRHVGRFIFNNSQKITVNSNFTKESVKKIDGKLNNSKIEIIPMGVDTQIFKPCGDKLDLSPNNEVIFSVGRFVEKKGFEYLIRAIPLILHAIPNCRLVIGGSGPDENKLKNLVKSLNIEKEVIFTGYIKSSELPMFYRVADVFVLPSIITKKGDTEGLGVVLLEAMACGTPVIGSNIGGVTDIIDDGYNGFLTEPQNPQDLARKIIKLISDEKLKQQFSEHGLKIIQIKFSWDVVMKKFCDVFGGVE